MHQLQTIAEDRRRSQAEKIAAWVGWFDHETSAGVDFGTSVQSTTELEFLIRNSSELPVYHAVMFIEKKLGSFPHFTFETVSATSLLTISPNVAARPVRVEGSRPLAGGPELRVGVLFRDALVLQP